MLGCTWPRRRSAEPHGHADGVWGCVGESVTGVEAASGRIGEEVDVGARRRVGSHPLEQAAQLPGRAAVACSRVLGVSPDRLLSSR